MSTEDYADYKKFFKKLTNRIEDNSYNPLSGVRFDEEVSQYTVKIKSITAPYKDEFRLDYNEITRTLDINTKSTQLYSYTIKKLLDDLKKFHNAKNILIDGYNITWSNFDSDDKGNTYLVIGSGAEDPIFHL